MALKQTDRDGTENPQQHNRGPERRAVLRREGWGPGRLLLCACAVALLLGATKARAQYVEATIMLPDTLGGLRRPWSIAYSTVSNRVYVGCEEGVFAVDATTNERLARVTTNGWVIELCYNPQNDKIYCADIDNGNVTVIACGTDSIIARRGDYTRAFCYNPAYNKVYCASTAEDRVVVLDGATNAVVATVDVGDSPRGLCYSPQNNKVYCANQFSGDVSVIDGASDSVIATVTSSGNPGPLCHNPEYNKVYCGNGTGNSVTIIDAEGKVALWQDWADLKKLREMLEKMTGKKS